jgi:hypothetical protein
LLAPFEKGVGCLGLGGWKGNNSSLPIT